MTPENDEFAAEETDEEPRKETQELHDAHTVLSDTPTPELAPANTEGEAPLEIEDPLIGRRVGNYEIVGLLGRGGFGNVYKARDTKLDRLAALKFLRVHLDAEHRNLFQREAKVIANLAKHPLIVQIFEWGVHEGNYYFALEYLEQSADRVLKDYEGGMPVREALAIAADSAEGLAYAHDRGVLHRDIKPANILIDEETGRAKLADFGLARFHNMGMSSMSGMIAGSPSYMSPEQASGKRVDPRSDVYSLGVTLYELLSGTLPHSATTTDEMLAKARKGAGTPLPKRRPDLPPEIHELVRKSTAQKPAGRYNTAKDFEKAIRAVLRSLDETGSTRAVPKPMSRWRGPAAAALVAAAFIGAAVLFSPGDTNQNQDVTQRTPAGIPFASALAAMDAGEYASAGEKLERYLVEDPGDDHARYALGFSRYLSDDLEGAKLAFADLSDPTTKAEGDALLAYAEHGTAAEDELKSLAEESDAPYAEYLLASIALQRSDPEAAIARLESLDPQRLRLDWQRAECAQLLGRANFALGDYTAALSAFQGASKKNAVPVARMAKAYEEKLRAELDEQDRQETLELIERIQTRQTERPAIPPNRWTSRPLRAWVLPASGDSSLATQTGLVDTLVSSVTSALVTRKDESLVDVVDRKNLNRMLGEIVLTQDSTAEDRNRYGLLLGARVLIESEFLPTNALSISITDAETTARMHSEIVELGRGVDVYAFGEQIAGRLLTALRERYPIQGILDAENGVAVIDIGDAVGVEPGMVFDIFAYEGARRPIEGVSARVAEVTSLTSARVELLGERAGVDGIPEDGLYVKRRAPEEEGA